MGTRKQSDESDRANDEAALSARLQRLGERLDEKSASRPPEAAPPPPSDTSAMARGLRLSTELVAGVVVGGVIGWLLDRWLGITPWGFILFVLLGFVAGMLSLMRSLGVMPDRNAKK
jgi:ATP synthase protein I